MSLKPATMDEQIAQAWMLQRQGRLQQAEDLAEQVYRHKPEDFDALRLLGAITRQTQRPERAVEMFTKAAAIRPDFAPVHNALGAALAAAKRPEEALASFDRAIALEKDFAEAHFNRGVLLQELTRHQDALRSYDRAIAANPRLAKAYNNRGVLLAHLRRLQEAIASYDNAIAIAPDYSEAYYNRGIALESLGRYQQALDNYDRAVLLKPSNFDAWVYRANILLNLNRGEEAVISYSRALELNPHHANAWLGRATARCELGRIDEAARDYREALKFGSDPELIRYELAKFGLVEIPPVVPTSLVVGLFDRFADRFDEHLVGKLNYRTPIELARLVELYRPPKPLDILDLGCGTGLVGFYVKQFASTLTGVDLSPNMLQKAEQRGIYDQLACSELAAFLSAGGRQYDVVVAADVFVYVGDLAHVFQLVRHALNDNGIFCLSVESSKEAGFALQLNGRYAHSREYLVAIAETCGFAIEAIEACVLRREMQNDVPGLVAALRPKP